MLVSYGVLQCGAVCCSVLQCGVVRCTLFQCVAVRYSMLQCARMLVCCSVLQYAAVCCSMLQCDKRCDCSPGNYPNEHCVYETETQTLWLTCIFHWVNSQERTSTAHHIVLQCFAVFCSVLQCNAV